MGGFRWSAATVAFVAFVGIVVAGCKSNASSAVNDEGSPTADTGYISAATTGGDAAGTANMKVDETDAQEGARSAERMQGGRSSRTPQQQGGGDRG